MAKKAKKPATKPTKLPWTPEQIAAVEDKLAEIQAKLREMRTALKQSNLDAVQWKFGTFLWHLSEMEPYLGPFKGELDSQIVAAANAAQREYAKATREHVSKNGLPVRAKH